MNFQGYARICNSVYISVEIYYIFLLNKDSKRQRWSPVNTFFIIRARQIDDYLCEELCIVKFLVDSFQVATE